MARVLIISFSDLGRDPRPARQIDFLGETHVVVCAGTAAPSDAGVEFVQLEPYHAVTHQPWTTARRLTNLALRRHEQVYWGNPAVRSGLRRLAKVDADVVIANDFTALPMALELGAPVIFDAHEYTPGEWEERAWWRLAWRPFFDAMCRRYIPRCAAMTTVSPGIARQYAAETGVQAVVLPSTPPYHALEPKPVGQPIRLLHHGLAHAARRIDLTIAAVKQLDDRFTLDLALMRMPGDDVPRLQRLAHGDPRIRFLAPVPMRELVRFGNDYDIGVFLLPPTSLNARFVLPNKFFEFIQSRLGVAIGPSPEMKRIVEEWDCGVVAEDFTSDALARALDALSAESVDRMKSQSNAAAATLSAEQTLGELSDLIDRTAATTVAASRRPGRP